MTNNNDGSTSISFHSAAWFSCIAIVCGGCAHAPEVSYALYDLNATGPEAKPVPEGARQLATKIVGDEPGTGAIKYTPTGSYVLIALPEEKPDKGAGSDVCQNPAPAAGGDPTGAAKKACDAVTRALGPKAKKTTITNSKQLDGATFTPTPGASTQFLIAITPTEHFYFKPNISATFESGSTRLTQLGADSQDTTVQVIGSAFGALAAIAPILGMSIKAVEPPKAPELQLPYVLDLTHAGVEKCISSMDSADVKDDQWCPFDTKLTNWKYRLQLKSKRIGRPLYRDAAEGDVAGFFTSASAPKDSREFPFAPCIQVALHIRNINETPVRDVSSDLTIADPTRVDTYLIPAKGSITIDSVCGANIKPQAYQGPTVLDIAKAVADGIKQLKGAQAPASSSAASPKK